MWTKRRVLALAAVALVLAGAFVLQRTIGAPTPPTAPAELLSHSTHPRPPPATHAAEIDRSMGAILALYHAPDGGTLCETAYNAFEASLDYSTRENATAAVLRLAPRDEFLRRCDALPPATQRCMAPLYMTQHKDECQQVKAADDVLAKMVELKQRAVAPPPVAEPDPGGSAQ